MMIKLERSDIGLIDALNIKNEENWKSKLALHDLDIIIDCENVKLKFSLLKELTKYQKGKNRCIVIIIPVEQQIEYPENWNLVPSKVEALDFISLEQIQRDLEF
tara:strand:+ start:581 stop:892 length:312 start_codon:yes stop_codon:yes gene_type:complete